MCHNIAIYVRVGGLVILIRDSYLSSTADDVEAIMSSDRDHEVLPYNAASSLSHMQPLLITGAIL